MKDKLKQELQLIYDSKAQSQNGKRITYLDMARGIVIFLVVFGHSEFVGPACNVWLSSFHLPTFFLLSGILMHMKEEDRRPVSGILLHKIKGIMLPYLWFSLGSVWIDFLQVLRGNFTWSILQEHVLQTVFLQGYSVLWFLPVVFFAELLLLLLYKASRRFACREAYCIVGVSFVISCCSVGAYYGYQRLIRSAVPILLLHTLRIFAKAMIAAAFMSYGYIFGYIFSGKAFSFCKWRIFPAGIVLFLLNIFAVPYIQLMDFNQLGLQNPLVYLGLGITGGIGCILICMSLPNIPIITFFGQNSLIIMCTHLNFYVLHAGMVLCRFLAGGLPESGRMLYAICSLTCAMILSIPVILIIRICFPFVLGRRYQRKS